ncbi:MAG: TerL protein [Gammaproteobacteria bacterium]|nr:TerL protein [Gammaproteobacteria bacterium]
MNAAVRAEDLFDFKRPDYVSIFQARIDRLNRIRKNPSQVAYLRAYYREHIADFINDWGCTLDPRNVARGLPAFLPFVLMPKQRELVDWIIARWKKNESGIVEKSRDVGASWTAMAVSISLCLFYDGIAVGFGSAKEDKLDRSGDPDTLFAKGRMFIEGLPPEFRAGFNGDKDSLYMRMIFRATGSSITGEAGDNIGRGGRKSIFLVDESAHLEHPELVDASLIANTDCRIDLSSVNGMDNSFARRRHSGNYPVFTFHYRDDLRKDDEWRERKQATTDTITWNAEYELDYLASREGVIIPPAHVQAAIDAHKKLGIKPSGAKEGALDVADEGKDLNAFAARHGILVTHCESWRGKGSFLHETAERAYLIADELLLESFCYDAEAMGAGIRSDVERINQRRAKERLRKVKVNPYRGSAEVFNPGAIVPGTERTAKDMFQNFKAQSHWELKRRFAETARAVLEGAEDYDPELIISIDSAIPDLSKLCIELSQAQWKISATGKLMVDKKPEGAASPNMADSIVMLMAPRARAMRISDSVFDEFDPRTRVF